MEGNKDQVKRGEGWRAKPRALAEFWPKIKTPVHLIVGQVIAWALRKWLG